MRYIDAVELGAALNFPRLILALRDGLKQEIITPPREHHEVTDAHDLLLMMPSWRQGNSVGVKLTSVFPSNLQRNMPMIHAVYTLFDGLTGKPKAVLDGTELTLRRTSALSALATQILACERRKSLLIIGTGALAPYIAEAHVSLGGFETVTIWGRSAGKPEKVVARLREMGIVAHVADDIADVAFHADVICCATSSHEPILTHNMVKPGTHINLIGAYMPDMREADSDLMVKAQIYADNRAAVLSEAGDILIPIDEGKLSSDCIIADMSEMVKTSPQQRLENTISVFKSVGFGALDLIAAQCALNIIK
jgi:ornithine cyclodeaminase/alanine dehydrogenase-like protein (mu-crystallin family)